MLHRVIHKMIVARLLLRHGVETPHDHAIMKIMFSHCCDVIYYVTIKPIYSMCFIKNIYPCFIVAEI